MIDLSRMMNLDKAIVIKTFSNEMFARMASLHLGALGIESIVQKDDCGGAYPQLQMSVGVRLLIAPEDKEQVETILNEMEVEQSSEDEEISDNSIYQGRFVFVSGILLGVFLSTIFFFLFGSNL